MTNEAKQADRKPANLRSTAPTIELLERPPLVMRRPLCLLAGRAYAATWLDVAVTYPDKRVTGGILIAAKPEMVKHEQRLYIVRDDGVVFGDGASEPLTALPFRIDLPEIPPQQKCGTIHGVSRYRRGIHPNPVALFGQIVDVIDHFIDFSRSLTDQRTMAELLAIYVFCTWLLEAFNVIGYLWPSGEHGSGKTQVLLLVAELSYLGMAIQAGGSYATLRDMADYGATLAFDDAENLASPRGTDPNKRTLLLAGNRRGSYVTVKEPVGKGRWRTRYVNAFCPRLFSAIKLPDSVLASRTIVLPLVRTTDRRKANAEPLDFNLWPHERQRLVDDLWAMATANLPGLVAGGYDGQVAGAAQLTGRNLEPWRAILAVARWMDDIDEQGLLQKPLSGSSAKGWVYPKTSGLYQRLETLSVLYQMERSGLEADGITRLVVQALCHCAIKANNAVSAGWGESAISQDALRFTVDEVKVAAQELSAEDGLEDMETLLSNRKVGWVLSRLRLKRAPRPGGKGSRVWQVTPEELRSLATSYGVPWPNLTDSVDVKEQDDAVVQTSDPYAQIARWVTSADKVESSWQG